ncbi:MAG TPA: hypothetical protein VFM46_12780, partial [Pseudomonadales bacterium]|nr:hypothetical protein [Pseudomonadales bacterium]
MSNQANKNHRALQLLTVTGIALLGSLVWYWGQQYETIEYSRIREKTKPQINELYAAEVFLNK